MRILEIPITQTPMTVSLTMKGVTYLKVGQYKRRHSGSKEILQQPISGLITKQDYYKQNPQEKQTTTRKNRKKPTENSDNPNQTTEQSPKREKSYTINKREVTHRILNFVNQMKGEKQLYLWTVTFPKNTNDKVCYKLLNTWLTRLRTEKMIKEYLWIAERQQNGTIHYHLAINNRMDIKKANKMMRASIMNLINKREIEYNRIDAAKYNGVDISKNRKTKRVTNFAKKKNQKALSNYLSKYVSKSTEKFTQLAWHNSRGYSNLIIAINLTGSEFHNSALRNAIDLTTQFEQEYFIHYRWKGSTPESLLKYLEYINNIALDL